MDNLPQWLLPRCRDDYDDNERVPKASVMDKKENLSSNRKPDITHVRSSLMIYIARACEYGSDKYERANYLHSTGNDARDHFQRFRSYLRACLSHVTAVLDSMEYHQAFDPSLDDTNGMRDAAYARDTDSGPDCSIGYSGLPHVAHAAASLMMAIEQATRYHLLPTDPRQPWNEK